MASEAKRPSERQDHRETALEHSGSGERGVMTRQYQDPFSAFEALFDRLQQNFFGTSLFNALLPGGGPESGGGPGVRIPRVQMRDAGDALEFVAEMPGVEPSNVSVNVEGAMLTIRGEARAEAEREGARTERYASFHRQIALPEGLDTEQAQASYKHGMLTIRFPKTRSSARKIEIAIEPGGQSSSGQKHGTERAA